MEVLEQIVHVETGCGNSPPSRAVRKAPRNGCLDIYEPTKKKAGDHSGPISALISGSIEVSCQQI